MSEPKLPYYSAPAGLRERVQSAVRQSPVRRSVARVPFMRIAGAAAAVVLLAWGGWSVGATSRESGAATTAVVDGHLRSLTPGHLSDVASTDQHTVKPWFAGKLDFSPPVVDGAANGFPLVGARLDVVGGRSVAAMVYSRRGHIINLFVRPVAANERATDQTTTRLGYNVVDWTAAGMRFWAVSDLNAAELAQFRDLLLAPRP